MRSPIQQYLDELHARLAKIDSGEMADYIPELAKANPEWFGICLVTMDGIAYSSGDTDQTFTIQSVSKPFVYGTALADRGVASVIQRVGVEPSGDAFNSISLDPKTGAPLNPMINAGAIATTAMVAGESSAERWQRIVASLSNFAGRPLELDEAVYQSESDTGYRNRAIAWMLKNFGITSEDDPMQSLENYFRQCSLQVSCRDLAFMAATLANGGVHPLTGVRALPEEHISRVLSVMATCGMYNYAGSWLYDVGMPAKSGVSGGILAVLPGRFGIGVFSPRLDEKGNSVRGIAACKQLSDDYSLHAFGRTGNPGMAVSRIYTGADAPSRRQPSQAMRVWLEANAPRIKYFSLHGYLGVDSVEYIIRRMHALRSEAGCFILDLHQVTGISDSAARLLNQTRLQLSAEQVAVVCSRLHRRRHLLEPLRKSGSSGTTGTTGDRGFLTFEDNDLAVEWCENFLYRDDKAAEPECQQLAATSLFAGLPESLLSELMAQSQCLTYDAGAQILTTGEQDDGRIFIIERGQVSILLALTAGEHQRIATLGAGMYFGEMALLGQTTRSATVFATTDVRCRVIDAAVIERIADQAPVLKIRLLENLARELANKLRGANQWIAALA